MSTILPIITISEFTRNPNKVLNENNPYTVIMTHNNDKGVIIQPSLFKKLISTKLWQELCEEWWEAHDAETKAVVRKGKKMIKTGKDKDAASFKV